MENTEHIYLNNTKNIEALYERLKTKFQLRLNLNCDNMLRYLLLVFLTLANLQEVTLEDSIQSNTSWFNGPKPSLLDVLFFNSNYEISSKSSTLTERKFDPIVSFKPKAKQVSKTSWKCWAQAITFLRPIDDVTTENIVGALGTVFIFGFFAMILQIRYGEITLAEFSILLIKTCLFMCGLQLAYDFYMFNVYISDCSNTIEFN